jgi:hypothetical protein
MKDQRVKARVFHNGAWSALNEAEFLVGVPASSENLRITEIHYHPANDGAREFIELQNISDEMIHLAGVHFTAGIEFDFTQGDIRSLAPGQYVIVVRDVAAFRAHYADSIPIAGTFEGRLDDGGEQIRLVDRNQTTIHDFVYDDESPWPNAADGLGMSLEPLDVRGDYNASSNWTTSSIQSGTPGSAEWLAGDSNLDGLFDSRDLVLIFQAGEYEDLVVGNASWADGDWNRDGDVTSADLVFAFQAGNYLAAAEVFEVFVARKSKH